MDIEQKQEELIDHFANRASSLTAAASSSSSLASLVSDATSHPSLFAFSEILSLPSLLQLEGTKNSVYLDVLRLFAHGTWSDYKSNAGHLPQLVSEQALKLKQLTMLTLAETNKGVPKQRDERTCGLWVMRYMRDIVHDKGLKFFEKWQARSALLCYNQEELDEVRAEWAKQVVTLKIGLTL